MPIIKCKENEGLPNACKHNIVYLDENIIAFDSGKAAFDKETNQKINSQPLKVKYLTLVCLDNHVNNYEIHQY